MKLPLGRIFRKWKAEEIFGGVIVLMSVMMYFFTVFKFAVNIPVWDEYAAALNFLEIYLKENYLQRMLLLFKQFNEHRIFSYLLTVVTEYNILGEINFRYIIIFGNLGMVGLLYCLYRLIDPSNRNILVFVPVVLLIMAPVNNITDWGILTMNSINEFLLVFAALSFLNRQGSTAFSIAIVLAFIATFSFGNGMIVFPAGLLILYFKSTRSSWMIFIWTFLMVAFIILYFINFNYTTSPYSKILILHQPFYGLYFFLTFFGGFIKLFGNHSHLLPITGCIILIITCYILLSKWKYFTEKPLIMAYLFFIFTSAVTVTISRIGFGIDTASANRYRLLPVIFLGIVYIAVINTRKQLNRNYLYLVVLGSLFLFSGRLMNSFKELKEQKLQTNWGLFSYYYNPDSTHLLCPNQQWASHRISTAISMGYYNPPDIMELYPENPSSENVTSIPESNTIMYWIDQVFEYQDLLYISGWAFINEKKVNNSQIMIVFKSAENVYVFPAIQVDRYDVKGVFEKDYQGATDHCGFKFHLNKSNFMFPRQEYQIGICIVKSGKMLGLRFTNTFIKFSTTKISSNPRRYH